MVKVLCVLTSNEKGFYLPEIAHPYFRFIAAGFDVDICSIEGGLPTVTPASIDLNDIENKRFFETPAIKSLTENTKPLSAFNTADYDAIFFVGGYGVMWDFPDSPVNINWHEIFFDMQLKYFLGGY